MINKLIILSNFLSFSKMKDNVVKPLLTAIYVSLVKLSAEYGKSFCKVW